MGAAVVSIRVVDAVCSDLYAICVNVCVFPILAGISFNSKGQIAGRRSKALAVSLAQPSIKFQIL